MNKTELFIKIPNNTQPIRFNDTYLAPSIFGTVLGLEFDRDVSDVLSVGDEILIDKDNKSINSWVDGTAFILGITVSSIYPAPSSLIFTDRPLQLPIIFSSGESGTIQLNNAVNTSGWTQVDLSDNLPFPVIFNIADVRDIINRNGSYSKSILIPGTKDNNNTFKNIFDIQSIDNYDTRIKVKVSVVVETVPVLDGYIQLNSITCDDNKNWTYECILFGENANFSKEIDQNARLEDLDFSQYDHNFTINNVQNSWLGQWSDVYYYPLINYNTLSDPNEGTTSNRWKLQFFRGCVYTKQYWDKIFENLGYTYESQFLNSNTFKNLIITPNKKYIENDKDWRFNSTFRAGLTASRFFTSIYPFVTLGLASPSAASNLNLEPVIDIIPTFISPNLVNTLQLNDTISPNVDPGGNFVQVPLGEFYYKNVFEGSALKKQKIVLNLDFEIDYNLASLVPGYTESFKGCRFTFFCNILQNNTVLSRQSILDYSQPTTELVVEDYNINNAIDSVYGSGEDWNDSLFNPLGGSLGRFQKQIVISSDPETNTVQLALNDEIRIQLGFVVVRKINQTSPNTSFEQQFNYLNTRYNIEFFPTTNGVDGTYFFNEVDDELIDTQPVKINEFIPRNYKQIDFISDITKMFNLYFYQDKLNPKNIFIEPRDDFYNTQFVDWSNKLDVDKDITQSPIVDRKKRVLLSYKEDKDFWNNDYKTKTNEIYGQYEYLTDNEFENSEQKILITLSPSPLVNRVSYNNTVDTRWIYTTILGNKIPLTEDLVNRSENNTRILFRKTIPVQTTRLKVNTVDGNNYFYSDYPYAGHLDDPYNATQDLNFYQPRFLYYKNEYLYPANNLYQSYYKQFFEEVYGPESKTIIAYFYLTSQDLLDFDFRKLVYIDNMSSGSPGYYRVNKIEYDPFNRDSYKVELIKVLNNTKISNNILIKYDNITVGPGLSNGLTLGGNSNTGNTNIIGGGDNLVNGDNNIVSGKDNTTVIGTDGGLISGNNNVLKGRNSSIIGGRLSNVSSDNSTIISGASNSISAPDGVIVNGRMNYIYSDSVNSNIFGGVDNKIGNNLATYSLPVINSFLIGGYSNSIATSTQSATDNVFIIGGQNNTIAGGVTNSIVIGATNLTATQSNTVYLEGNVLINGLAPSVTTPIAVDEIAFGTGTGITSLSFWKFTTGRSALLGNSGLTDTSTGALAASNVLGTFSGAYTTMLSSKNSTIEGFHNSIISSFYSSILSNSYSNRNSTILGGVNNHINGSSSVSSIIGGSGSIINNSCYSVILGGTGLTLNNECNTVLVPKLKIATASNTSASRILVWDNDNYVKYRDVSTIGGGGSGSAINIDEIAFGTGTGITSSTELKFNPTTKSSIIGGYSNTLSSSYRSSVVGGQCNTLSSSNKASVVGGQCNSLSCYSNYSSIIGGFCNTLSCYSYSSSIVGGQCNTLSCQSNNSSIVGGYKNTSSCYSNFSSIIGGQSNTLSCYSVFSSIIGGCNNTLTCYSNNSSIVGGINNTLSRYSNYSSVIGGQCNILSESSGDSSIIGGFHNSLCSQSNNSSIIGGQCNSLSIQSSFSSIIGGCSNIIATQSSFSSIIGGCNNTLTCYSSFSSIIGGSGSTICNNSCNSVILGGIGLTLNNECNTVLVPNLKVNDDISLTNVSGLEPVSGGGPVTISTSYIKTGSKVFLTGMNGASDAWYVDNIVNGVSFDITALTTGGTGDIAWLIIN